MVWGDEKSKFAGEGEAAGRRREWSGGDSGGLIEGRWNVQGRLDMMMKLERKGKKSGRQAEIGREEDNE